MDMQLARLTTVIDAVATRHFYPHLLAYLERFFAFDNAIVYAFEQDRPPRCLLKAEKENSDRVNALYQQGAYLQDPFYHALNDGRQGDVFTLRQLAPRGFYHSDYYRNFYRKTGWRDEAGVVLQLTPQRRLGVFFGASQRTVALRQPQQETLRDALMLVRSVARLHGDAAGEADAAPVAPYDRGAAARAMLTPREREIVDLILAGQGSPQIAERLFISLGTVKNHRKNIYGKLGIGSQAELFSLLLGPTLPPGA